MELLIDSLVERFPTAKRQTLKRMVEAGRVTINGRIARRLKEPVGPGDEVRVDERPREPGRRDDLPGRGGTLKIVYEDPDILIVNKPAGLLTSTTPREPRPTLLKLVREYLAAREPQARVGLIHRLDKEASGLLVFSKSDPAYNSLKEQFFHHTVRRVYLAVTHGVPDAREGRIESRLVERTDGSVHSTKQHGKGEHAITHYQVIRDDGRRALVRVLLETGRKHQIRAHLSERGTPIVGDTMYGPGGKAGGPLMLAAVELELHHPRTGQRMRFNIPAPRWARPHQPPSS